MAGDGVTARDRIGIIGTGHLAGFLVAGWHRHAAPPPFVVSPRNAAQAATLAQEYGVAIARDNQDVVDRSDLVVVAVLPGQGHDVARSLRFRAGQIVLSVMAGVPHGAIAALAAPAAAVVAMMPGLANARGAGPSCIFPENAPVRAFLSALGPVHALPDTEAFTAASVFGAFSGCTFRFMAEAIAWFEAHGVDAPTARALVAETLAGNAAVVRASTEPLAALMTGIATPGGITEQGLRVLEREGALAAWSKAMDAVHARLRGAC